MELWEIVMIRLPAAIKADQYDALNEFGRNGTDSMLVAAWAQRIPDGVRQFCDELLARAVE
jgi:hypothetical protein